MKTSKDFRKTILNVICVVLKIFLKIFLGEFIVMELYDTSQEKYKDDGGRKY